MASTTRATANILLGRTGGDPSYRRLADALRADGYQVSEQPTSPIGAHSSSADASGVLDGVDMAFLAVRDADDVSAIGPVRPFQRVARDVGIMQGRLGMDRVVLLVEDSVAGLSSDLGVGILRLPPGGADGAIDEIKRRIQQAVPAGAAGGAVVAAREPDRGIHQKLSTIERSRADSMFMPILLIGVIALMALIGAIVILASLLGGGGGDDEARVQLIDVTESLRAGQSGGGTGSIGVAGEDGDGASASPSGSSADAPAPVGPSAGFGGDNQLLPATCELDLMAGSLDEAVDCAGAGVLVLDGSDGPWHNEIRAVALSDGVSGELVYERTGGVLALDDGFEVLDAEEAAYGVSSITVSFSAVGQHIHLLDAVEGPDRQATLTLRLER